MVGKFTIRVDRLRVELDRGEYFLGLRSVAVDSTHVDSSEIISFFIRELSSQCILTLGDAVLGLFLLDAGSLEMSLVAAVSTDGIFGRTQISRVRLLATPSASLRFACPVVCWSCRFMFDAIPL